MQYADFVAQAATRQRYWARSFAGWRRISAAAPNPTHAALAELERLDHVHRLVTQNVDGLHQKAGSRGVIDLHGRLDRIECLDCGIDADRQAFQTRLEQLNPACQAARGEIAPDGDMALADADYTGFRVPGCSACDGILKPSVVFFGESVPRERVQQAFADFEAADAMLVVGSSLMVFSGFRFARRAVFHWRSSTWEQRARIISRR